MSESYPSPYIVDGKENIVPETNEALVNKMSQTITPYMLTNQVHEKQRQKSHVAEHTKPHEKHSLLDNLPSWTTENQPQHHASKFNLPV